MAKRTGAGVRDAGHFEHGGDVSVAAVALDSVCHVEDHSGGVLLWIRWHKCLQCCKQGVVSFTEYYFVTISAQCVLNTTDGPFSIPLKAFESEFVVYAQTAAILYHRYLHGFSSSMYGHAVRDHRFCVMGSDVSLHVVKH